MDTQQLRAIMKQKRACLNDNEIKQSSVLIAKQLMNCTEFIEAKHIAYYLPVAGEADPTLVLGGKNSDKVFYLPTLKQGADIGLDFIKTTQDTCFINNKFGIQEPLFNQADLIKPEKLDMVITPLVGFDRQGNRIGMGGGFYDRTFSFKQSNNSLKPLLIGYAYDFQQVDTLTPEAWDVKLDGFVTEKGFTRC